MGCPPPQPTRGGERRELDPQLGLGRSPGRKHALTLNVTERFILLGEKKMQCFCLI